MNASELKRLFDQVRSGKLTADEAVDKLRHMPFEDLGFAKVDHHRSLRAGMPEVIFGPGKKPAHLAEIFGRLAEHGNNVLATRVTPEQVRAVRRKFRESKSNEIARTLVLRQNREKLGKGTVAIVCAGTSDVPVAEEAAVTAELMGNDVARIYDVGVAGIHRLLAHKLELSEARVLVVCAGMEGALPSVVGGLVGVPVIAVPTRVGDGASFY